MLSQGLKSGQTEGYFAPITYKSDAYKQNNMYLQSQPRGGRRLGFGSGDARRRDEFMHELRALQYKELLRREYAFTNKFAREAVNKVQGGGGSLRGGPMYESMRDPALPPLFQTQVTHQLYDIGRTGNGTTPICNRCSRETFYCKHRVGRGEFTARRKGLLNTSSEVVGSGLTEDCITKPQHGIRSQIKEFFDQNHLHVSHGQE